MKKLMTSLSLVAGVTTLAACSSDKKEQAPSSTEIVTIAILNFIASWNAFLWPLLITNNDKMRVLTIGLTHFTNESGSQVHLQMAAATIIIIPVVIIYLFLQKYIISGVTRGGLKG